MVKVKVSNILCRSLDELSQVYSLDATGVTLSEAFYIVKETQAIMKRMADMDRHMHKMIDIALENK